MGSVALIVSRMNAVHATSSYTLTLLVRDHTCMSAQVCAHMFLLQLDDMLLVMVGLVNDVPTAEDCVITFSQTLTSRVLLLTGIHITLLQWHF